MGGNQARQRRVLKQGALAERYLDRGQHGGVRSTPATATDIATLCTRNPGGTQGSAGALLTSGTGDGMAPAASCGLWNRGPARWSVTDYHGGGGDPAKGPSLARKTGLAGGEAVAIRRYGRKRTHNISRHDPCRLRIPASGLRSSFDATNNSRLARRCDVCVNNENVSPTTQERCEVRPNIQYSALCRMQ